MKVFAKFDEIPSMILEVIKETKRYGHTFGRTVVRSAGQRENSIPSHKHSLRVTVNNNNTCIKIMQKVREKHLKALYIYAYTKAMALIKFT